MNIKAATDKKFWSGIITAVVTAALGYFGYEQVQSSGGADVDVEVIVPDQEHAHRNWQGNINSAIRRHIDEYH